MNKLAFFSQIVNKQLSGQSRYCPHCESERTILIQRKKILLELRQCQECFLMYRYPKDGVADNIDFYQSEYQEGMTTDMPDEVELKKLLELGFRGSQIDLSNNIQIVKQYINHGSLLDYGCSWGYGVNQFNQAGYDAVGFEISKSRSEYGRKHLSVKILDELLDLEQFQPHSFDIIHTSHVLEHLPELTQAFSLFQKLIKPTGYLIIFVPNAGGQSARNLGVGWGPMIGEKHTLALDARFFANNLPKYGFIPVFNSPPYDNTPVAYESEEQASMAFPGDELLVIARPINS
ncbi:MAG: class I SAM-dependent methyltransferase [Nostoc sp.]|uniref:class I SAM-dependent methyltransferase n=1 Tax=Nostoc sp. TaxID=1180 RepID=UPI002FF95FA3